MLDFLAVGRVLSVVSKQAALESGSSFHIAAWLLSKFNTLTIASCKYIQDFTERRSPTSGVIQLSGVA